MIIGIVAIAENHAIGKDGKLPWHYPADLKFFKRTTIGHALVMGYNTWKSIGRPLPQRLNIVLSRTKTIAPRPGLLVLRSREELGELIKYLACDLFVIGGAQTYRNFAGDIERWIVTEIPKRIGEADTFMPKNFLEEFRLSRTEEIEDGLRIRTYDRRDD